MDRQGRPVLIDIEDLMYFDVEWEHVFLKIRLHDDYRHLAVDDRDEDRFARYMPRLVRSYSVASEVPPFQTTPTWR